MEIPIPELSNDLEWMLQSGQASIQMLAEALLNEYYAPVYRLALSMLNDPEVARQATLEVFSNALMQVYRYRSEVGVDFWVYRFALEVFRRAGLQMKLHQLVKSPFSLKSLTSDVRNPTHTAPIDSQLWRAVDRMRGNLRLVTLLHYILGWQVEPIARLLKIREGAVHADLRTARLAIIMALDKNPVQGRMLGAEISEEDITRSLQSRWPEIRFSEQEFEQALSDLGQQAAKRGRARRQTNRLKEVALTIVGIVVAVVLIYGVDRSLPDANVTQTPPVAVAVAQAATPEPSKVQPTPFKISTITPTFPPKDYFYIVQPGDSLRLISRQLDIPAVILRKVNRIPPLGKIEPGQALYIPPNWLSNDVTLPEDIPSPTVVPTEPVSNPLTSPYKLGLVLAKMQGFDWLHRTVWLDAQSLDLGPAGYIGPPKVRRIQTWLGQNQFLMIAGTLDGNLQDVWLRTNGHLYRANLQGNLPWFFEGARSDMFQNPTVRDLFTLLSDITLNSNSSGGLFLGLAGNDQVAGRQAVIVERKDQQGQVRSRFWVDVQTGFILRVQWMDDKDPQIVRNDIVVTSIAFDVNFPQELFNSQLPWRGGFALDSTGNPENPGMAELAVPGRDRFSNRNLSPVSNYANSSLTFQYPPNFAENDPHALVQVSANKVYIGDVNFGNPWTMICQRSSDGNKIAFVSQPTLSPDQDAFLNWFNLSNKGKGLISLIGIYVTDFAFAPDSQRLAFFGYDGQFSEGAVYILDTETGKYNQLMWLHNARSLAWSPDGEDLAFVGKEQPFSNEETIVMNAITGEVIYRGPAATDNQLVASDAPINQWGSQFPVKMGGLEACSSASVK
jgi:DNA-directed RNA polymerase specialized sigma24 family protein